MHLNGVDLNLLIALNALLEERNVTRAARRLFLSQSAMSGALARLREHYQDPLLVRSGRKLVPTALAEGLMASVRTILTQIESTLERRQYFMPGASTRTFRIMASDYGSIVLLPEIVRQIKGQAPDVSLEIHPFTDSPKDALERGEIDLLLMAKGYLSPIHPSEKLLSDRFVIVCCAHNRNIGRRLSVEQLLKLDYAVVKYGEHGNPYIESRLFQNLGYTRRVDVTVSSFSAVPHFIVGTDRVTVMHERLARIYAKSLPLRILPLPIDIPAVDVWMQWHTFRGQDSGNEWLRGLFKELLQSRDVAKAADIAAPCADSRHHIDSL